MFTKNYKSYLFTAILSLSFLTSCGSANVSQNAENNAAKPTQTVTAKANEKPKEKTEVKKQEELVEIFDGRKDLDFRDYSKEETQTVQAEFDRKKTEIKEKFGDKYCSETEDEKIGVNGIAEGSFTKPHSKQKVFLYTLCTSGSSHFGVGGIVIFENGKAISHFVYGEHGLQSGLIYSPDVNQNGLNELVLIDYQMHQGNSGTGIILAEIVKGELKFLGEVVTSSSNSGAVENEKDIISNAYRISVQPSANPVFYRDSYEIKGNKKDWKEVKKGEKFSLDKEKNYAEDFKSLEITQWN